MKFEIMKEVFFLITNKDLIKIKHEEARSINVIENPASMGLLETILLVNKKPVLIKEHLLRMEKSAKQTGIFFDHEKVLNSQIIPGHPVKSKLGVLRLLLFPLGKKKSFLQVQIKKYPYKKDFLKKGVRICFSSYQRAGKDSRYYHKTTLRDEYEALKKEANARGYFDAIAINEHGRICETSNANIFAVFGNKATTPPVEEGILPGIVRGFLLDGNIPGVKFEEKPLTKQELLQADEVFLTNSLIGVLPVFCVEEKPFSKHEKTDFIARNIWKIFLEMANF